VNVPLAVIAIGAELVILVPTLSRSGWPSRARAERVARGGGVP